MLDALLAYSLKNRLASFVFSVVLAVVGYFAYRDLTIEAFPDPTDTQVQVITRFPGQPTEEIERRISIPIERALNGTPGLFRLRSISLFGLSFVTLTSDDGVELSSARQRVLEKLRDAELPERVQPELGPMATPIGEVYRYTLTGASADPMTLRTLQDWVVRPELLRVAGVADVVSYGGLVKEIHVQPDPVRLATHGVTLNEVFSAISKASSNATGGYVERGSEVFVIRSVGIFRSIDDISGTMVAAVRSRLRDGDDHFNAVTGGARDRLRAVLMTALLAALGLLPAALSHAIGSETQRPIAVVVVGGTITAAILTLIVLPVSFYWILEFRSVWDRARVRRAEANLARLQARRVGRPA